MSQEKYIYLIYQQIQGVIAPSDEEVLQKWLKDSPENLKIQKEITQSMALMDDYKPSFPIDEAGDYIKIRQKLGLSDSTPQQAKSVKLVNRRRWLGAAAAIALLVSVALFFINSPEPVLEWTSFESTEDSRKQITLPDGTVAYLNNESKIEFPKEFLGNSRPVKIQGEVFFKVKPNKDKPFQISARNSRVTVLGTQFNVRDYPEETTTTVTVHSGKVAFTDSKDDKRVVLTADQAATMDLNTNTISKQESANPNAFSYQSGELVFKNAPLTEVFSDLEKHFNVKIDCQNQALKKCKYSITKQEIDLDNFLEILKTFYQIEVKKKDDKTYIILGGGDGC